MAWTYIEELPIIFHKLLDFKEEDSINLVGETKKSSLLTCSLATIQL
jgi:hypothetical protein